MSARDEDIDLDEEQSQLDSESNSPAFIQTLKNIYNHLLESYIGLISSMSSPVLHQLFYEIIQKYLFIPELATDLKIYILKITDKVIAICQGDLILSHNFLNSLVNQMLRRKQPGDLSHCPVSETVHKACQNLWQSLRLRVFQNYNQKGIKSLCEWICNNLVSLASEDNEEEIHMKANLLFDIVQLIASQPR